MALGMLLDKGIEKGTTDIVSKALVSIWNRLKVNYQKYMVPTPEHFVKNMVDNYLKLSKIKCLAMNSARLDLKKIYIPLTLSAQDNDSIQYLVDRYDASFFQSHKQTLIVDTAGMGKSTLVKKLFLDIIDSGSGIPVFIELRRLTAEHSLVEEFYKQVTLSGSTMTPELLYSFIREGAFIFILDGYDEIAFSEKKAVTEALQDFITHSRDNIFIMTSRQELALASFEGFEVYTINRLKKVEAFSLLRKYDDSKELAELLISMLSATNDYNEFLGNPLLTSMLLTAFSFKNEIPRQKHVFYRNVFDAYYGSHDEMKGGAYHHEKHSGLESEDFHRLLRFLGALCLKIGKIEFVKDELIHTIEQAIKLCPGIECSAGDFFTDLLEVVPLFVQDGLYYKWAHKSLYEYFVAQNIYRDLPDKGRALNGLASDARIGTCINILDLYYEIDYVAFRKYLIKDLFEQVVNYVELESKNLTKQEIRKMQYFFNQTDFFFCYCPKKAKLDFDSIARSIPYHQRRRMIFTKFHSWFVASNNVHNRNDFLIRLLVQKKHPAVFSPYMLKLTSCDLTPGIIYHVMKDDDDVLSPEQIDTILLPLMESIGFYIDYFKAKEEIHDIEQDSKFVDVFAADLFS